MLIKKVKLENIRSYLNGEIEFPNGSVLLAGDIGSGKSSVLLAVDFALFGIRGNDLSGSSLLRNGKDNGSVEVHLDIDGRDIIIKRNLKRTKNSVAQDSGYILINGDKKDVSTLELKDYVLGLLNYPKGLLTKRKNLIYRYTVYTPQEEMKAILIGEKDDRLDTLRKVFGIDKYKIIRENSEKFMGNVKGRIKEFIGMVVDLDDKKDEIKELREEKGIFEKELKEVEELVNFKKKIVKEKREELGNIENKINELNKIRNEISINEININHLKEHINNIEEELTELDEEIINLKLELGKEVVEDVSNKINEKESILKRLEEELRDYIENKNELDVRFSDSKKIIEDIYELDVCPICKQKVDLKHKDEVVRKEKEKIEKYNERISVFARKIKEIEDEINDEKIELNKLRSIEKNLESLKLKRKNLDGNEKKYKIINENLNKSKLELKSLLEKKKLFEEKLKNFENIEISYNNLKDKFEKARDEERNIELKYTELLSDFKNIEKNMINLDKEIKEKENIKDKIVYLNKLIEWFDKHFINLMEVIERKIMFKVHNDFNLLFEKWFSMLVDDENIKVKLDEEFTPVIEQGGYVIDYGFLSGGEKTAAALAYRLALNQVINNLIETVKTRDLLVLDEPTDGFSEQQLDRMRNVLDELNLKQIIIVSHDNKIESFVDNVIRFSKEGHVSRVFS